MQQLAGKVVVITGASSGLGRALALEFAKAGARLVLAARREQALEAAAQGCRELGGFVHTVVTDVTRPDEVDRLAQTAVQVASGLDIWINNAGVTLFASLLDDSALDEHRRVIETNLFGALHGARAAMPLFRKQGYGTLINVGSILSKVGQPFVPSYVISKFALRGLTDALRAEFADEQDIHVCTALPYAMNTPHFESAASNAEHPAHAMAPEQAPLKVARAIVDLARNPRRELHVPRIATLGLALHALAPRTVERLILHLLQRYHFDGRSQPATTGNLYAPNDERGPIRGHRPPQLTTARAFAFVLRDLWRLQGEAFERALANLRRSLRVVLGLPSVPLIPPTTVAALSSGHD